MMEDVVKTASVIENEAVKKWKKGGKKVLGYACNATPVEVIEAAGLLPYRIRAAGNTQTEVADAHLSRFNCSFCRSCLQLGLDGTYDFLDGLVESNGCDHIRGMFENWQYVKKVDFFHYVKIPHIVDEDSMKYFHEEIELFAKALEKKFDVEITDAKLWAAIENQQKIRDKLKKLYALREKQKPGLSATHALAVFLAGTAMPVDEYHHLLDRTIEYAKNNEITGFRARLILLGSATDEIDFIRAIEKIGGLIVTDGLCYGHRAFWPQTAEKQKNPYEALAKMYLENLFCPRMFAEYHRRRDYVFDSIERADVQGVITVHNKFCDVHGVDNVQLRIDLEKKGIPVLSLEKEYGSKADEGRMKTRVQAFLERIGGH